MRFRDTRPEPPTGAKYPALPTGQLLAEAFALGSQEAFTPPRKDPHRSPMHMRYQAAMRHGLGVARLLRAVAEGKPWAKKIQARLDAEEAAS